MYNAALGAANRRVTGRLADGWLPHNVPLENLDTLFDDIRSAADAADRDPADIEVRPFVPVAVAEDPQVARAALRKHIAYYVGNSTGYRQALKEEFSSQVGDITREWNEDRHEKAAETVTDEMVDGVGVAGTPEGARERLASLYDRSVVDALVLVVPLQADRDLTMQTFEALSPPNVTGGE